MKKVLILLGKSDWEQSICFKSKQVKNSYEYFYTLCKEKNIQVYRASYEWYDYKKNIFNYAWIFEGKSANWKRVYDIKPDLIYDKTKARPESYYNKERIARKYTLFNDLEFTKLIDNKLYTPALFPEWSTQNFLVNSYDEINQRLEHIKGEMVVCKPVGLSGGENVFIEKKQDLIKKLKKEKIKVDCYLLQDFIDSSFGIPRVMKGVHDFRLVLVNERVSYAYFREPAKGELKANIALGGRLEMVSLGMVPKSVEPIVKKANQIFYSFGDRLFTIDLIFDKNEKPWVVELNSMPGMFFAPKHRDSKEQLYRDLLGIFRKKLGV